jgi:hypothetical protein
MSYSQIFLDACNTNILMLLVKQKWHPTYFQLVMGTVVVLITAFELRFHHKKDPVPQRLLRCFSRKNVISDSTAKTALMLLVKQKWHPTYVFHC